MAKKYKPKVGDEIEFFYDKEKHTGTVAWIASSGVVSVYPHTLEVKDSQGVPIDMDWFVETGEVIGEVKNVQHS